MSLNRSEDALLRYLRSHPDEQRFWQARVVEIDRRPVSAESRAVELERELRQYAAERAASDPGLGEAIGAGSVSLRNLAEYLLRAWPPPRSPRRPAT